MQLKQTDLCISNAVVKTGIGFSAGVVLSVLLFRRKSKTMSQSLIQTTALNSPSSLTLRPCLTLKDEPSPYGLELDSVSDLHTLIASARSTLWLCPVFVLSPPPPPHRFQQPARHRRLHSRSCNKRRVKPSLLPRHRRLTVSKRRRTRAPALSKRRSRRVSRLSMQPGPRRRRSRTRCAEFRFGP